MAIRKLLPSNGQTGIAIGMKTKKRGKCRVHMQELAVDVFEGDNYFMQSLYYLSTAFQLVVFVFVVAQR